MITAFGMACMLWLPQPVYTVEAVAPPLGTPVSSCPQCQGRDWNLVDHDENWGLLFTRSVCPLGTSMPCGVDGYAAQMRRPRPPLYVEPPVPEPAKPASASTSSR